MQFRRIALFALVGVGGAFGFGVIANACLDLLWPATTSAAVPAATMELASVSSKPVKLDPAPAPVVAATVPAPTAKAENLVGTTEVRPVRVRTIPMVLTRTDPEPALPASALPYAAAPSAPVNPATAAIMPKPRPSVREAAVAPTAPAKPAKPRHNPEDDQLVLSDGQIDRIRTALALSPDQEGYWPAIAAELRAIGKAQPKRGATKGAAPKLQVDDESVQRLYAAATPLVMRLREDQKRTIRQLATMLGLQEVASAI
jgi:hypothetical protein